jgi:hypothetical protein
MHKFANCNFDDLLDVTGGQGHTVNGRRVSAGPTNGQVVDQEKIKRNQQKVADGWKAAGKGASAALTIIGIIGWFN